MPNIKSVQGVEVGIGNDDPLFSISEKLVALYPGRLVLVQCGNWLQGYNRTAYVLNVLKKYKLQLKGPFAQPHLRAGFSISNFKQKLWSLVDQFDIPYVVAIGTQADGYELFLSEEAKGSQPVLDAVSEDIVSKVIADLASNRTINKANASKQLANPAIATFRLKEVAEQLDTQIIFDICKLPRDLRATWGESLRTASQRLLRNVYTYGNEDNKTRLLKQISVDIDLLKHSFLQVKQFSRIRINFEDRVGSIVELGRLTGGLIKSNGGQP